MLFVILFFIAAVAFAYLWYTHNSRLIAVETNVERLFQRIINQAVMAKQAAPQTGKPAPTSKA